MSQGRHSTGRHVRRVPVFIGSVILVLGLLAVGSAYGAFRYDRSNSGRILPGVKVAGVDVGGMSRDDAIAAASAEANLWLSQRLEVASAGHTWRVTPAELGVTANVSASVDDAFAVAGSYSWLSRAFLRLAGRPVTASFDVEYSFDKAVAEKFVKGAAGSVLKDPVSASIAIGPDGALVVTHSKAGQELDLIAGLRNIREALNTHQASAKLPLDKIRPEVSNQDMGKAIVVRISQNRLYLYDGFKIEKTYPVATAAPGYTTPLGSWTVINKVENPTWINPAPNGWGAGEPATIPPGPGNPLGTRALYLDAPGIRIHGTPDSASIGSYASHGCIRMLISDSEDLYPRVPIGIPALIIK